MINHVVVPNLGIHEKANAQVWYHGVFPRAKADDNACESIMLNNVTLEIMDGE